MFGKWLKKKVAEVVAPGLREIQRRDKALNEQCKKLALKQSAVKDMIQTGLDDLTLLHRETEGIRSQLKELQLSVKGLGDMLRNQNLKDEDERVLVGNAIAKQVRNLPA